jgi:hypothetical protein
MMRILEVGLKQLHLLINDVGPKNATIYLHQNNMTAIYKPELQDSQFCWFESVGIILGLVVLCSSGILSSRLDLPTPALFSTQSVHKTLFLNLTKGICTEQSQSVKGTVSRDGD